MSGDSSKNQVCDFRSKDKPCVPEKMASSKCHQLRAKGNAEYKQLSEGSCVFAAPVRRRKLVLACQQYMDALGCSHTAAERAACFKNLGMLHVMWGKFEFQDAMEEGAAADSSKLACLKP